MVSTPGATGVLPHSLLHLLFRQPVQHGNADLGGVTKQVGVGRGAGGHFSATGAGSLHATRMTAAETTISRMRAALTVKVFFMLKIAPCIQFTCEPLANRPQFSEWGASGGAPTS